MGLQMIAAAGQRGGGAEIVVIEDGQQRSGGAGDALVEGGKQAGVLLPHHPQNRPVSGEDFRGAVGGAVVDDDDLLGWTALAQQ